MTEKRHTVAVAIENTDDVRAAVAQAIWANDAEIIDIDGFGSFDWVVLDASSGKFPPRRFTGPLVATSLRGRYRGSADPLGMLTGAFYRESEGGLEAMGGIVVDGAVSRLELRISFPESIGETKVASPRSPSKNDWARLAEESKRVEQTAPLAEEKEEKLPSSGDRVRHPTFGVCVVARVDDDHILLQKSDGRVVQLGLSILKFQAAGMEGKHALWTVRVRK